MEDNIIEKALQDEIEPSKQEITVMKDNITKEMNKL